MRVPSFFCEEPTHGSGAKHATDVTGGSGEATPMEDIHPPTHAGIKGKAAQRAAVHTEVQVATQLAPPKFFGSRGMGRERPFA